jgi:hypothetical protein
MKANLTKNKITIAGLITLLSLTTACFDTGKVEQSEADTNLIVGLLAGQEQGRNALQGSLIAIRGSWEQYSCSNGNCPTTGNPGARVYIKSEPGTNRGFFFQQNPSSAGNFDANRLIIKFDNANKVLFYKSLANSGAFQTGTPFPAEGKFSFLVWTELDGEIYSCDKSTAKDDLISAEEDYRSAINNTITLNNIKSGGCNGVSLGWNYWKRIEGVL